MTPSDTRRAAAVMIASLKKGAVVEFRRRIDSGDKWYTIIEPIWNWFIFDYRIAKTKKRKRK